MEMSGTESNPPSTAQRPSDHAPVIADFDLSAI